MLRVENCRSCDARIVWMITNADKNMPVNADSVDELELTWTFPKGSMVSKPLFDPEQHESHFATCKDADSWRRGST